jgi:hypothetical protein
VKVVAFTGEEASRRSRWRGSNQQSRSHLAGPVGPAPVLCPIHVDGCLSPVRTAPIVEPLTLLRELSFRLTLAYGALLAAALKHGAHPTDPNDEW